MLTGGGEAGGSESPPEITVVLDWQQEILDLDPSN